MDFASIHHPFGGTSIYGTSQVMSAIAAEADTASVWGLKNQVIGRALFTVRGWL